MLGGLIVQLACQRFGRVAVIDHGLMQRVGGTALDFLVVAAISMIRINVIAAGLPPFLLIVSGGILWNVFCVMWLARRLLPDSWFERAMAEMGQSMGVTATGLLLLRVVDPENETEAASAFGYKQLLHEPFMGGGLWTSAAVLLVWRHGGWWVLGVSVGAIAAWLLVWRLLLRPSSR
jgi:ESS family glutamate:Na+ symporter